MAKKGKQRNQVTTVEDEDADGFGGLGAMAFADDLFEDNEHQDHGGQGAWGAEAAGDPWGLGPGDSASNVNGGGGAWPAAAAAGGWGQQMQQQHQQHHGHQQHQHHAQQQQQQQKGGKQAQAQAGAGRMDPRLAAANVAAMAMQGHLQQMQAGSLHEQMQMQKMAQMAQLREELAKAQGQLHNHQQHQQHQQQQHQQQQQNGKGESRGRKKNKNKGNNDAWASDGGGEWGGGGGGGSAGAWGAAAAQRQDPWGMGGGGGGGNQANAPDPWGVAVGNAQQGADPWGASAQQNGNNGGWNQEATWDDNEWGNEGGGGGGGAWGEDARGGTGGARGTPMSAQQALQNALRQAHRNSQAPTMTPADSWAGWGQMQENGYPGHGKTPKVTVQAPSADEGRTVLSEKQQHSHVLQSLFGALRGTQGGQRGRSSSPNGKKKGKGEGKKGKKNKKQSTPYASPWHGINVIEEEPEEEFEEEYEGGDNDWYNNAQSGWNDPSYTMPSKAYALAGDGRDPVGMHQQQSPYMDIRFNDSQGAAIALARLAFYNSQGRKARERIHWLFNPNKDESVSSLLAWIQQVSPQLAAFGLNKFLQGRERGALFVNAGYRSPHAQDQPAFDWLTYDQIHPTFDKTLQESIAYYDVHTQVFVFVFLLSKSGNSMAIWRRRLILPNNLRLTFGAQITQAKAALRKQYPIYLDENPEDVPPPVPVKEKKRRWFMFGR